jgi:hypothetical protein
METTLLSSVPLVCVFSVLAYAVVVGDRVHTSTGGVSIFGIAATLFGLIVGWLLERFVPPPVSIDDWVSYRSIKLEVALLFLFVSALTLLGIALVRRDALVRPAPAAPGKFALLVPIFFLGVATAARAKIAALLVILLVKVNL